VLHLLEPELPLQTKFGVKFLLQGAARSGAIAKVDVTVGGSHQTVYETAILPFPHR